VRRDLAVSGHSGCATMQDLISLRIHGVDGRYARAMRGHNRN
jgi:hypothetical protein